MGTRVGENYLEIPVYRVIQLLMLKVQKTEVYVTGVTLEGDIEHNAPAEFMSMCLVNPSGTGSEVEIDANGMKFVFGYPADGGVRLGSLRHPRVDMLANKAFKDTHRDGSLFGAPLNEDVSSRLSLCDTSVNAGKVIKSKTGRCAIGLSARPVGTSLASSVAKTTSPQMIIVLDHGYGRSP
ncbi:hypothetical protein CMUS01_16818 [Colletotrichum musicola]|uniref:Uncharacterized protein n=2 Tax=Colletotrichum orchidearum species complex TaxID=2707337 RepID=A0A8H6IL21_9PEZI|nr:hypothetical protein CMUS01_16818 [Colletotrichum musicola]